MISVSVDAARVYRALGDDVRLGMVKKIAASSAPIAGCQVVSSCSSLLKLSQPTASHHFAKLVDAGVLVEKKVGTQKLYSIDYDVLRLCGVDVKQL